MLKRLQTAKDSSHYAAERGNVQYKVQWRKAKAASSRNLGLPSKEELSSLSGSGLLTQSSFDHGMDRRSNLLSEELEDIHDSLKQSKGNSQPRADVL